MDKICHNFNEDIKSWAPSFKEVWVVCVYMVCLWLFCDERVVVRHVKRPMKERRLFEFAANTFMHIYIHINQTCLTLS